MLPLERRNLQISPILLLGKKKGRKVIFYFLNLYVKKILNLIYMLGTSPLPLQAY
jgi:hypothetical protein